VDAIEYTLTKDSSALSADEITTRQNKALEDVKPYLTKKNIVGVRANMLAADISFQKKDYNNSRTYWLAAVAAGKKAYTAPICWYNAAICSEELGDNENAAKQYESASNESDFLLVTHALFSLGRVKETLNDYTSASQAYQKMVQTLRRARSLQSRLSKCALDVAEIRRLSRRTVSSSSSAAFLLHLTRTIRPVSVWWQRLCWSLSATTIRCL
jgi:tetratricopeptide (TPR) repeat protein